MMPYIIILKVRKFHQPTANRFGTTRQKLVGGTMCPPSLNRVNPFERSRQFEHENHDVHDICTSKSVSQLVRTIERLIENPHLSLVVMATRDRREIDQIRTKI